MPTLCQTDANLDGPMEVYAGSLSWNITYRLGKNQVIPLEAYPLRSGTKQNGSGLDQWIYMQSGFIL